MKMLKRKLRSEMGLLNSLQAGILRLFEIPAPPTPHERRKERRAAYTPSGTNMVHVPFKQKMSTVISVFAKEVQDDTVSADPRNFHTMVHLHS